MMHHGDFTSNNVPGVELCDKAVSEPYNWTVNAGSSEGKVLKM